jgi:hypothetical protein
MAAIPEDVILLQEKYEGYLAFMGATPMDGLSLEDPVEFHGRLIVCPSPHKPFGILEVRDNPDVQTKIFRIGHYVQGITHYDADKKVFYPICTRRQAIGKTLIARFEHMQLLDNNHQLLIS